MYAVYELSSRLCPMLNYMPKNILQKNPYAVALVVGSSLILALFSTIQSLHNTFDVLSDCRCLVHTGKVISLNLWKKNTNTGRTFGEPYPWCNFVYAKRDEVEEKKEGIEGGFFMLGMCLPT